MTPLLWSIPGRAKVRLFFSVLPPDDLAPVIETLGAIKRRAHALRAHAITRERLHNTLALAYRPQAPLDEIIARAKQAGDALAHPAFPVRFDWTGSFHHRDRRYPLVLRGDDGLEALVSFRGELADRMRSAGFLVEQNFTPHITLLWADRCVEEYPVAPIYWTVREFVLTVSLVGQSRHIHVARWPLQ
jgi:RNA 2',3'-cyclic 3'-phosphodiesterase